MGHYKIHLSSKEQPLFPSPHPLLFFSLYFILVNPSHPQHSHGVRSLEHKQSFNKLKYILNCT